MAMRALERHEAERAELPQVSHDARAEVAAIEAILARRRDLALAAARVSPPDYIVAELGERPAEGKRRATWDSAVREIEGYRQRNGIRDRGTALGAESAERSASWERERAQRAIRRAQRELMQRLERVRAAMEIEL
jgi:hypothetical protein